ncbi:MAG: hypothetical protein H6626_02350 [Pseudobdellovibrionaceae bacterium]|nr:hypothetical protein [Bdellovibrionales bacterium]USN47953.1 MAG: hypothetical protein H6626_02350 [Pseudobdellovibrionaceae bacterium]
MVLVSHNTDSYWNSFESLIDIPSQNEIAKSTHAGLLETLVGRAEETTLIHLDQANDLGHLSIIACVACLILGRLFRGRSCTNNIAQPLVFSEPADSEIII